MKLWNHFKSKRQKPSEKNFVHLEDRRKQMRRVDRRALLIGFIGAVCFIISGEYDWHEGFLLLGSVALIGAFVMMVQDL
jgi:hypothetical protein